VKTKKAKLNAVRNSTSWGHPAKRKTSNRINAIRCPLYAAVYLLAFITGCENDHKKKISLADQIEQLTQEKTQLVSQLQKAETEKKQLSEQVQVLIDIRPEVKPEDLYVLQKVKIHRYSGFYDKDKDGKKEKLIVYVQPMDRHGDLIKAPGAVDVQLEHWDGKSLGRWHVDASELKTLWFSTLIKGNYRLMFDIADKVDDFTEPSTVKVTFTDYLTGRVFKQQRAIKP
jgi:hypothetical protein